MKTREYKDAEGCPFKVWRGARPGEPRIIVDSEGLIVLDANMARTLAADLIAFADSQTETTEEEG